MDLVLVLLKVACYVMFVAIFVRVAFSWIGPRPTNPIYRFTFDITEPVLAPIRNRLPSGGIGMDFSPMIVSFVLIIVINFLSRAGA